MAMRMLIVCMFGGSHKVKHPNATIFQRLRPATAGSGKADTCRMSILSGLQTYAKQRPITTREIFAIVGSPSPLMVYQV